MDELPTTLESVHVESKGGCCVQRSGVFGVAPPSIVINILQDVSGDTAILPPASFHGMEFQ
jgi:hypothetical protein